MCSSSVPAAVADPIPTQARAVTRPSLSVFRHSKLSGGGARCRLPALRPRSPNPTSNLQLDRIPAGPLTLRQRCEMVAANQGTPRPSAVHSAKCGPLDSSEHPQISTRYLRAWLKREAACQHTGPLQNFGSFLTAIMNSRFRKFALGSERTYYAIATPASPFVAKSLTAWFGSRILSEFQTATPQTQHAQHAQQSCTACRGFGATLD